MANYIDSGSIVAGAVALPIWTTQFGFGSSFVSLLVGAARTPSRPGGALIGGRFCDRLGRKLIYQWDLLLYAFDGCGSSSPSRRGCCCSAISSSA